MITTLLDVLGTLLIIAALAVYGAAAIGGVFAVGIGLTIGGVLVLVFSWMLTKKGGEP